MDMARRNLFGEGNDGIVEEVAFGWSVAKRIGLKLRDIYKVLRKLPLTPVRSNVLTLQIAHLERGLAAMDRGIQPFISGEERLLHSDKIADSYHASLEWLWEHLSSAKDSMLSFRKNSRCERFFLNGPSPDNDQRLNEAIEAFRRTIIFLDLMKKLAKQKNWTLAAS